MEADKKYCVVNSAYGAWYPRGQMRLRTSLIHHGFGGDILTWTNEWANGNYDRTCIYNLKAAALEEAQSRNYTHILWADCSVWAVRDVSEIFDIINSKGYYFLMSGYNCAQTCSDKCLEYFGISRDEAEKMPDSSTMVMGINLENPLGQEFLKRFLQAAKDGVFSGSREHDGQSNDPRFLFHRQDQSAASIIINQMGLDMEPFGERVLYYESKMDDKIILAARGM